MLHFLLIFFCMLAGFMCRRLRSFPQSSAQSLNAFVIYLSLPAVILYQVPPLLSSMKIDSTILIPVSMAWLHFGLSFAFFVWLGKRLNWSAPKVGALILTAGLGNTSFVGLPLLEALIGPQAIPLGILVDQPGSFLVLSTLGIVTAASFAGSSVPASVIARRVLTFPPFVALCVAILWTATGSYQYDSLSTMLAKIAGTLVPMALFAVGFQLRLDTKVLKKRWNPLFAGLAFKLVLAPVIFALLYMKFWRGDDLTTQVTVIESAMAPMITSAIVATEFNLDSEIANLMVGVGIPLSLLTVPLWNAILF